VREPTTVGLFIPVYHRDSKVRACLESLKSMRQSFELDVHVMVGINGASLELREWLSSMRPSIDNPYPWDSYEVYDYGENLGKPKMVNRLVEAMASKRKIDYVISCDSDMVAHNPTWVYEFVHAFECFPIWKDLGCLATQQTGECCHVLDKDPIHYTSPCGRYTYTTTAGNDGVAGGCIITPYYVWRTIGGYFANRLYASDDGHYVLSCAQRGLVMAVVNEVSLEHPGGDDPAYRAWKLRAVTDSLTPEEMKGFYG